MSKTKDESRANEMSREDVLARMQVVLKALLNLETTEAVAPHARLLEDLGLDSLAMVDLIIEIEENFALELQSAGSVALFESVRTVNDAADLIVRLRGESRGTMHGESQLA